MVDLIRHNKYSLSTKYITMKKSIVILTLLSGFTIIINSCRPDVKKEVIVVPEKTSKTIIEKAPEKKATTITLDKNGVKVEARKIDVSIKKD